VPTVTTPTELGELREEAASCTRCPLYEYATPAARRGASAGSVRPRRRPSGEGLAIIERRTVLSPAHAS